MNYTALFTIAARTEQAYTAAQSFIADECPILEQRLKKAALTTAIDALTIALTIIDWVTDEFEKAPEYALKIRIAQIEAKRFGVRQLIKIAQFDNRYKLTATGRKLWERKASLATSALDRIFSLT